MIVHGNKLSGGVCSQESANLHGIGERQFASYNIDSPDHHNVIDSGFVKDARCVTKFKSSSENESCSWESDDGVPERKRKHRKHKKKKKKKKKKHRSEDSSDVGGHVSTQLNTKPDTIWLDETNLDHTNAFRKDSRSDQCNFEFQSLYKNDIADFRPLISCECLGLNKRQRIVLYPNKVKRKRKSDAPLRYFMSGDKESYQDVESNTFIHTVESEDFLPLLTSKHEKTDFDISNETVPANSQTSCLKRNKYFSEKLAEDPSDINTWLSFVDYQDEVVLNEVGERFIHTPKAITEKKISILEKAIYKNQLSSELILKYMYHANEIWPHDKLQEKWKNILFGIPNRSVLWRHYILYLQSDMLTMKVSSVVDAYRSACRMLIGVFNRTVLSHHLEEKAEENLLMLFLQLVIFLWQAGHTERATCLLQCMIEFNYFCPQDLVCEEHKKQLSEFERFFESQLPRFGLDGARGWNQTIEDSRNIINSVTSSYTTCPIRSFDEELESLKNKKSKQELWLILETLRSTNEFLPFLGNHDDCEDTERIVLFDDVSFALFSLSSIDLKHQLVLSYLFLVGVPIPRRFLHEIVLQSFSVYYVIEEATTVLPCYCHHPIFNDYVMISSELFSGSSIRPNVLSAVREIISQYICTLQTDKYIRQVSRLWFHLESTILRYEFEHTGSSFETCKESQKSYKVSMKKFIRSLLKLNANRSCVFLWSMYGLYEWNIGNVGDAKKIFMTALRMTHADAEETIFKVAIIIRNLLDLCLDWNSYDTKNIKPLHHCKSTILNICLAFIDSNVESAFDERTPNSIALLKLSTVVKSTFKSIRNPTNKIDFLSCYLVFIYLFHGLTTLIQTTNELQELYLKDTCVTDVSDVFCYVLFLLQSHHTSEAFTAYKQLLEKCIHAYPKHLPFSKLFNSLKQYGLGSYKARRFYDDAMKSYNDIRPWLYAIEYEENRMKFTNCTPCENEKMELEFVDAHTGIHNRIRSLYAQLLRQDSFKHCSSVWIRFVKFQLVYGSKRQAIDSVYTALRNCPAVKMLYLLICEKFEGRFAEMLKLMDEKEVRMKLLVEELDILLEEN